MNGKLLASSAAALALASSLFALPALAESAKNAPKPAANTTAPAATTTAPAAAADAKADAKTEAKSEVKSEALSIMRYSEDGGRAIREIGAARVAIFNGDTKLASELITRAKASVAKAEQEAPTFKVQNDESGKAGAANETVKAPMVPVDGDLVLAEDFVPTPDKRARIEKANEHFKNGNARDALEELRLGDIAVMYTRAWMPLAAAAKHLDQAVKYMDAQKYYEANLSLKAIGDSITVDSVAINEAVKPKS